MTTLSIFVILSFLSYVVAFEPYSSFSKLDLPAGDAGPESVALNPLNQGPFVSINDGRVLKYQGSNGNFVDFAITSPNRTKQLCDGVSNPDLGPTCGRILGMSFNSLTGDLYMVDPYLAGIYVVGPRGGLATLVTNIAGGVPLHFPVGIDIDQTTGDLYVSDVSLTYNLRNVTLMPNLVRDSTGRLIKVDYKTKKARVLLSGLGSPMGPAVSEDGTYVLFPEYNTKTVKKYWLRGPKANTIELVLTLPGTPRKIKRATVFGEFWVPAIFSDQQTAFTTPYGYRFTSDGTILQIKDFQREYYNTSVSVIQEYNAIEIYVGSRGVDFVGTYRTS